MKNRGLFLFIFFLGVFFSFNHSWGAFSSTRSSFPHLGIHKNIPNLSLNLFNIFDNFLKGKGEFQTESYNAYLESLTSLSEIWGISPSETELLLSGKAFIYSDYEPIEICLEKTCHHFKRGSLVTQKFLDLLIQSFDKKTYDLLNNYRKASQDIQRKNILQEALLHTDNNIVTLMTNLYPLVHLKKVVGDTNYANPQKFSICLISVNFRTSGTLLFYEHALKILNDSNSEEKKILIEEHLKKMFTIQYHFIQKVHLKIFESTELGKFFAPQIVPNIDWEGALFRDYGNTITYSPLDYLFYQMVKDKNGKKFLAHLLTTLVHENHHFEQFLWMLLFNKDDNFYLEKSEENDKQLKKTRPDIRNLSKFRELNQKLVSSWQSIGPHKNHDYREEERAKKYWQDYKIGKFVQPVSLDDIGLKSNWFESPITKYKLKVFYCNLKQYEKYCQKSNKEKWPLSASEIAGLKKYDEGEEQYFKKDLMEVHAYSLGKEFEKYLHPFLGIPPINMSWKERKLQKIIEW